MTAYRPHRYQSEKTIDAEIAEISTEEARLMARLATLRDRRESLESEFEARGGWTRAFIVTDGHVHRSTACSTCFPTTRFGWLTDLSGDDEATIVEKAGERACTVCYPTAPVAVLERPSTLRTEEEKDRDAARAEREAAKVAREAKRIANAPTASGAPLVLEANGYRETFKTERAALIWAVDQVCYRGFGYAFDEAGVQRVAEAVAEKRGVEAAEVLAEIEKKGAAKEKRERRAL